MDTSKASRSQRRHVDFFVQLVDDAFGRVADVEVRNIEEVYLSEELIVVVRNKTDRMDVLELIVVHDIICLVFCSNVEDGHLAWR